jgi:S1-C subfamily serine protease
LAGVDNPTIRVKGKGKAFEGTVVFFDPARDVALIRTKDFPSVALRISEPLSRSESAVVAGFPGGGPLTLIGHTSHIFIEWGFLSNIASSLDGGKARDLYNDYVSIDGAFQQAIKSGDASTGYKLADKWRIAQNEVDESYENLLELLGLAQTDWD